MRVRGEAVRRSVGLVQFRHGRPLQGMTCVALEIDLGTLPANLTHQHTSGHTPHLFLHSPSPPFFTGSCTLEYRSTHHIRIGRLDTRTCACSWAPAMAPKVEPHIHCSEGCSALTVAARRYQSAPGARRRQAGEHRRPNSQRRPSSRPLRRRKSESQTLR